MTMTRRTHLRLAVMMMMMHLHHLDVLLMSTKEHLKAPTKTGHKNWCKSCYEKECNIQKLRICKHAPYGYGY